VGKAAAAEESGWRKTAAAQDAEELKVSAGCARA
jgi:hypothetical protein